MPPRSALRVGVDASRATVTQRTGTERYAYELITALIKLNTRAGGGASPPRQLRLYFRDPPAPGLFPGAEHRLIRSPRLWTHAGLSLELLRARPDVLFVPAHVLPLLHPVPSVVTVHDLGYHYFPDAHPARQRRYLEWSTRFSARGANHLLADSQATRADLVALYGVASEKVTVVYPGRDESLAPTDPAPVRARYHLPDDYLLHVGTLQPRKNLLRLMEAVAALREQGQNVNLVLAGRAGWLKTFSRGSWEENLCINALCRIFSVCVHKESKSSRPWGERSFLSDFSRRQAWVKTEGILEPEQC